MEKKTRQAPINTLQGFRLKLRGKVNEIKSGNITSEPISRYTPGEQEEGQISFVESDTLPTQGPGPLGTPENLSAIGVKFHDLVEDDELFQYVDLPQGWKKVPTDVPEFSLLLDEKDRPRAEIYYNATPAERQAWIRLLCRYGVKMSNEDPKMRGQGTDYLYKDFHSKGELIFNQMVMDGDKVIYSTPLVKVRQLFFPTLGLPLLEWAQRQHSRTALWGELDRSRDEAINWLQEHFPAWEDPMAYWD
jgi:hypothetical protein